VSNLPPSFDRPSSDSVMPGVPEKLVRQVGSEPPPIREGLPPTFRMRADSHYVDSLDRVSAAADRVSAAPSTSVFPAKDEHVATDASGFSDDQAVAELTRCLRTLELSPSLLGPSGSPLTRSVAVRLIRAESRRATCFLQAVRVMRDEVRACPKRLAIHDVVTRVLQAVEPERCLRNVVLKSQLMPSHSGVHADEELLVGALASVLLATFALVDGTDVPVCVSARVNPQGEFSFLVTQDGISASGAWTARAAEDAAGQQSGESAALLIATARRAAEACGGKMTVTASRCGNDIHISVPLVS
jgi:hypothetical protein